MYEEENKEDIHKDGLGLAEHYSPEIKDLVKKLLVRDPIERLGHDDSHCDGTKILLHPAFEILTLDNDGGPDDNTEGYVFHKPQLFDVNQDFELKKKEKDAALMENDEDDDFFNQDKHKDAFKDLESIAS